MDPSDRLDTLVERARVLFESKYGPSNDCFAAFSPAKVNLMGDFVEGSGGLVLQMTLDRRVVVFGRGRSLPRYRPAGAGAKGKEGTGTGPGNHRGGAGELNRDAKAQDIDGGRELQEPDEGEPVLLNSVPKWSSRNEKKTGKAGMMDAMVQDLVFGKKNRRKTTTTAAFSDSTATSPASVTRTSSPMPSSSKGVGASGGGDTSRKGSWSSTPSTSRHDSSASGHGSTSRLSAPIEAQSISGSGAPPRPVSGAFNVLPIQIHRPESAGLASREYFGSIESGSTTTEETFPNDNSSSVFNSTGSLGAGVGGGGGGGGAENGGLNGGDRGISSRQTPVVNGEPSPAPPHTNNGVSASSKHLGGGGGRGRVASVESTVSGVSLSLDAEIVDEDELPDYVEVSGHGPSSAEGEGFPNEAAFFSARSSERTSGGGGGANCTPDSLLKRPASEPVVRNSVFGGRGVGGAVGGNSRQRSPPGAGANAAVADNEEAGVSSEENPLQRLIATAQAAEQEAERLRACRVYCEACPKDGVLEFFASTGMRGGGDSWQGLVTAVVAEYVPEVVPGEILGLEAVVVSDLPGGQGQGVRVLDTTGKYVAQEGAGHGWAEAARSALLMASATFLEEVLDMRPFPRMKAIRCHSAAVRCRRAPGQRDGRKPWSGAAPSSPFACEDFRASQGWDSVDSMAGGGGGGERGGPRVEETVGGTSLEDLLVIADDNAPGAVLVDSRSRTQWPFSVRGPNGEGLAVIIAQPLDLETAQRLKWQAEHERAKGAATCRAVVHAAKGRHPEASTLRDVSAEALEALISIGTVRGQGKGTAAAAAAANESWWSAGRPCGGWGSGGGGGSSRPGGGGLSSPSGVVVEGTGSGEVGRGGGAFARRKLTPEVLAHARHLAAEVQRVKDVALALTVGDMEAVGRFMLNSRRSAGLSVTGSRGRPEPPEPAAARLAAMASRLPGVYGSRQSEGRGSGAAGAVVALIDPDSVEGVLRAISTRGVVATGVRWGGFAARPGGGSGIVRTVYGGGEGRAGRR